MRIAVQSLSALALLACGAHAAHACDPAGQKVVEVMSETVGAYDAQGNFVSEVPKAQVRVGENILACKDSPALVQLRLTDGRTIWADRLEVKVSGGPEAAPRPCKTRPISQASDTTTPATSGIDPCRK